ncbi:hypothetical protein C7212DRAFT_203642, partial [Tuber magnatum]
YGRTPLSWAARRGHEEVVKILLERRDVDAATQDNDGQTPLSWALCEGHDGVARVLVGHSNSVLKSQRFLDLNHAEISGSSLNRQVLEWVKVNPVGEESGDQPGFPSSDANERARVFHSKDSAPSSGNGDFSSTKPVRFSQLPPLWFLKPWYRKNKDSQIS